MAVRIMRTSALVGQVAKPSALKVLASGRWGDARDPERKPLGVELFVRRRPPAAIDADLPYVAIPPDSTMLTGDCVYPYAQGWIHENSTGVSRLWILVDLRSGRRRVVEIDTNASSGTRSWVPGKPHPQCNDTSGGGG
jgi:hypothetical protein